MQGGASCRFVNFLSTWMLHPYIVRPGIFELRSAQFRQLPFQVYLNVSYVIILIAQRCIYCFLNSK